MNYKQKLEAMSDGELNFLMFESICKDLCQYLGDNKAKVDCGNESFYIDLDDYCNNYNYTMPLAFEQELRFTSMFKDKYQVNKYNKDLCIKVTHKNPLRAAVIVLLSMNEEKG